MSNCPRCQQDTMRDGWYAFPNSSNWHSLRCPQCLFLMAAHDDYVSGELQRLIDAENERTRLCYLMIVLIDRVEQVEARLAEMQPRRLRLKPTIAKPA